jgi:hypothetical protein
MKLASITCVKNESDILETFVRVNSAFIDTFIFIDDSDDGTEQLYSLLAQEGFRIIVLHREVKKPPYRQDLMIMAAMSHAKRAGLRFDYFLPLDVDEFPQFRSLPDAARSLGSIPDDGIAFYDWETYIPISAEFDSVAENGLINCFGRREPEGNRFQKIIISASLAERVHVAVGAHTAVAYDGSVLPSILLDKRLGHFPVRSAKQIIKKNFSAVYGLLRKENRFLGEGYHVIDTLKQIRATGFRLTLKELQEVAITYANEHPLGRDIGNSPDWINKYKLRYIEKTRQEFEKTLMEMVLDSWTSPFNADSIKDFIELMRQEA